MIDAPELVLQTIADARAFWPDVRRDLELVRERCAEDWMPDDAWYHILTGDAHLWTAGEPGDLQAFVILQLDLRPYRRALHIWQAGEHTPFSAQDYWPQLVQIAANHQCGMITFESPRLGWKRALPDIEHRHLFTYRL